MTQDEERVRDQWESMLTRMLRDYRAHRPGDPRSDCELLDSLMQHFYDDGLVQKDEQGKYLLPRIVF